MPQTIYIPGSQTMIEQNQLIERDKKSDIIGFLLAWICLLPLALLVGFVTLILFRRDLHTLSFFVGQLCCEVVGFVLKNIIQESRPSFHNHGTTFTHYGMPSSHSQFMWFFATYTLFFLFVRLRRTGNFVTDTVWRAGIVVVVFLAAFLVSYGRVHLLYHTSQQVFWGAVLGILLAIIWFAVVMLVLTPLFPTVASWPVSEFLMIRDSTLIPNVMWFEYTSTRTESRARQRKLVTMKSQ
ncbi:PREDICTED: dolichyldiphosphatase 1-like isoform X2 [Priapulus caudatus]|uniref:Dolichyldiphosphatase n=1 Tax=Priapulus caudatus TaxID=37621 RepID=A0ABM1DWX3_PRICU|nr:PREDICTED: dolichyldiphosphatase 1-like isoform X2 [Priapulus caudatus]